MEGIDQTTLELFEAMQDAVEGEYSIEFGHREVEALGLELNQLPKLRARVAELELERDEAIARAERAEKSHEEGAAVRLKLHRERERSSGLRQSGYGMGWMKPGRSSLYSWINPIYHTGSSVIWRVAKSTQPQRCGEVSSDSAVCKHLLRCNENFGLCTCRF